MATETLRVNFFWALVAKLCKRLFVHSHTTELYNSIERKKIAKTFSKTILDIGKKIVKPAAFNKDRGTKIPQT